MVTPEGRRCVLDEVAKLEPCGFEEAITLG